MQQLPRWVNALALCGVLAGAPVLAAGPTVRLGDGLGTIRAFDLGRGTVVVNGQAVALRPEAAASLQRQLALQGWKVGTPFQARYNVVADGGGKRAIDSIHVFRPRAW